MLKFVKVVTHTVRKRYAYLDCSSSCIGGCTCRTSKTLLDRHVVVGIRLSLTEAPCRHRHPLPQRVGYEDLVVALHLALEQMVAAKPAATVETIMLRYMSTLDLKMSHRVEMSLASGLHASIRQLAT